MKAITFQVFDHFANSATISLTLAWSQASKYGKIATVAWNPYLNTWTLCFYKERSVFGHRSQVVCEIFFVWIQRSYKGQSSLQKLYFRLYLNRSFIQTVKCSFFNQIIVYQSFYGVLLAFSDCLLQGKDICVSAHVSEMFVAKTLSNLYLWFYLTQIIH